MIKNMNELKNASIIQYKILANQYKYIFILKKIVEWLELYSWGFK